MAEHLFGTWTFCPCGSIGNTKLRWNSVDFLVECTQGVQSSAIMRDILSVVTKCSGGQRSVETHSRILVKGQVIINLGYFARDVEIKIKETSQPTWVRERKSKSGPGKSYLKHIFIYVFMCICVPSVVH